MTNPDGKKNFFIYLLNIAVIFTLVVLLLELGYFTYLKKRNSSVRQDSNKVDSNTSVSITPNNKGPFEPCFIGDNIDMAGFLIKGQVVKTDLNNNYIDVSCTNQNATKLVITPDTRYWKKVNIPTTPDVTSSAELSNRSYYRQKTDASFLSLINPNAVVSINIFEKDGVYYVNSLSVFETDLIK
jgi:hypothetical protein